MNARTLNDHMTYLGMERDARKVLLEEKLATADEVAVMTSIDVCEKLLETYDVVSIEKEKILVVKWEDKDLFQKITKTLSR